MPDATLRRLAQTVIVLAASICLAGCSSASDEAIKDWEFIQKNGTGREKCEAAAKVADAFRAERNASQFEQWKVTRDIYCMSSQLDDKIGPLK